MDLHVPVKALLAIGQPEQALVTFEDCLSLWQGKIPSSRDWIHSDEADEEE